MYNCVTWKSCHLAEKEKGVMSQKGLLSVLSWSCILKAEVNVGRREQCWHPQPSDHFFPLFTSLLLKSMVLAWELFRNAEPQAARPTYWIQTCIFTKFPGWFMSRRKFEICFKSQEYYVNCFQSSSLPKKKFIKITTAYSGLQVLLWF